MGAIGGDILEITWNHKTKGSGRLYPKAGEDNTFNVGGFTGSDDMQMVDGSGSSIRQLTGGRWKVGATVSWDMNEADELAEMQELSGDPQEAEWTVTLSNGTVWAGTGAPVGDLEGNVSQGTFAIVISGGGKLKKIAG